MAQRRSNEISVLEARHKIFNLCTAYRRSAQDPDFGLRAYDVMVELAMPLSLFAEALDGFVDVNGEFIVEMFERNETLLEQSQRLQDLCSGLHVSLRVHHQLLNELGAFSKAVDGSKNRKAK